MSGPPWHLVVVPHTHWDREWYRTHDAFRARLVRLLDGLLDVLDHDPDFRHFTLDGQTIVVDDYLAVRPDARTRIEKAVRAGRLVVGPWRVLPDEWLVSGEALIRNLRRGLRDAQRLGGAMPVGYVPDPFGHVGQLPQILGGFGLEGAALWRGVGADIDRTLFHWESPDGTAVPTVYLIRSYGNAAGLPTDPEALAARLREEIAALAPHSPGPTLLLMAGMDHAVPEPRLPAALAAAVAHMEGVTAEIGTLPGFLRRALAEVRGPLPRHRGELRSGLRAPLLPGCASTRMPQKRAEFRNDARLVHVLEPLAAWLGALGGRADPGWLDFTWELALENHAHDSVCGCSIDAVHDEMDARFARVAGRMDAELERVAPALVGRVALPPAEAGDGPGLVVWNPHAAGTWPFETELELEPTARGAARRGAQEAWHLRTSDGARHPVHVAAAEPPHVLFHMTLPRSLVRRMLDEVREELFGHWLHGASLAGGRLEIRVGRSPCAGLDVEALRARVRDALAGADAPVQVHVIRPRRVRITAALPLPGHGLRAVRLAPDAAPPADPVSARATPEGGARLSGAEWQVDVDPEGRVTLLHGDSGARVADALAVVSEGDRGDSYNFDPVPGDTPVRDPERVRVRVGASGPAHASAVIEARYRVPAGLARGRKARSRRRVALPVRTELHLHAGTDRLDVRVHVDNTARDHRLRLHVAAPFAARRLHVESAFEVPERPMAPARDAFGPGIPAEWPVGAGPQRRFATLEGDGLALTVANRGLAEVEGLPVGEGRAELAVTLLRAVGWLSRDDLALRPGPAGPKLPVPGAQVPGPHVGEVSIRLHPVGEAQALAAAHAFAVPPVAFVSRASEPGALADGARLVRVDDPAVVVTALEPRPGGAWIVRLWNAAPKPRRLRVAPGPAVARAERVDLAERPVAELSPAAPRGFDVALEGHELCTVRFERG